LINWIRPLIPHWARPKKDDSRHRLGGIELRGSDGLIRTIRLHVDNLTNGEEAGFLLCGHARVEDRHVLLGREWIPVPDIEKVRRGRYGLEWTPRFAANVLARADAMRCAAVLIHSHGPSPNPRLSSDDADTAERVLTGFSRILGYPCGSVVLGRASAGGAFYHPDGRLEELSCVRIVGSPLELWHPKLQEEVPPRRRLDRQNRAIGPKSDARLRQSRVAVVGVCGGGSHVCQQLAHQGVGCIVPIDRELVEDVNLGRMIGSAPRDVNRTPKTAVMRRLIENTDPDIRVVEVHAAFPEKQSLEALKSVDLVIACVDSFLVREQINAFCRRHLLPMVDVGMNIRTEAGILERADGQVVVVLPDSACLRCTPLLSDPVLDRERRERPPEYDLNPNALGDPQVVSMNGVLASEACNSALDLLTGYAGGHRGPGWWGYDGRRGELVRYDLPPRKKGCPACAEQGHGDPRSA
jgi:molybdopterin/thiamine biosynthesis adenylyltransferase